jgi:hypothetical protein
MISCGHVSDLEFLAFHEYGRWALKMHGPGMYLEMISLDHRKFSDFKRGTGPAPIS